MKNIFRYGLISRVVRPPGMRLPPGWRLSKLSSIFRQMSDVTWEMISFRNALNLVLYKLAYSIGTLLEIGVPFGCHMTPSGAK